MQSWWDYRPWKFIADMNRDRVVSIDDLRLWVEWLYFMPGDALIAQFGPTPLGSFLDLSPASFGSGTSALLSAALWLVGSLALVQILRLLRDAIDPTYRQQQRERREAEARRLRGRKELERRIYADRVFRRFTPWLIVGLVVLLLAVLALAFVKDQL